MATDSNPMPLVALYVTCLVNSQRPTSGFAAVKLLQQAGFKVEVPLEQTCCGQPAYNNGLKAEAQAVARLQIKALEPYDWVVVPSGSCGGMISVHYPDLFAEDPIWHQRALRLAAKTRELAAFLDEQEIRFKPVSTTAPSAHHTSCSCRRETRSHDKADAQLRQCLGDNLKTFAEPEVCCGFGGTFSAKFDAVSARMGSNKLDQIEASGATTVISADLGCLLHLQGLALRQQRNLTFRHLADVLADAEPAQ